MILHPTELQLFSFFDGYKSLVKNNMKNKKLETKPDTDFLQFSEAHALYGGRKRYVMSEFKNLKVLHDDWKEIIPLLKGAIQNLIAWREAKEKAGEFVPEYKLFSNWIKEKYWEYEFPIDNKIQNSVLKEKTPVPASSIFGNV